MKDFHLGTPLDQSYYSHIYVKYIPTDFMNKHNLWDLVEDRLLYMEINKGMYGSPQGGRLANNYLKKRLLTH